MSLAETGAKIIKAVLQDKWLSIEYKNKQGELTKYWIGVLDIDAATGRFAADGFHVTRLAMRAEMTGLYVRSIVSAEIIDESWHASPEALKEKIRQHPEQFERLFGYAANLHILDYLYDCARLNSTPYKSQYALIERLDGDALQGGEYALAPEQFGKLVRAFQSKIKKKTTFTLTKYLCMNVLSIYTRRGLYVLAYRGLRLDAKRRALVPDAEITVCKEFQAGKGEKESIRAFLDNDEQELLNDFEANLESIKDALSRRLRFPAEKVDDLPYIMPISRTLHLRLENEYSFIKEAMANGKAEPPLRAFFGELTRPPIRRKKYPLALLSRRANLDQLLAMHNAIKYPLCYVQGPPGTGKTATILNTIVAAFFNGKTVLFSTFNNHPIDEVCASLEALRCNGQSVPFPIFRIGNNALTLSSLNAWKERYLRYSSVPLAEPLEQNQEKAVTDEFAELISRYEEKLDLEERKDAIEQLLTISANMTYQLELPAQLEEVERQIAELGEVSNEKALSLLRINQGELLQWLYLESIRRIKQLGRNENRAILDIILMEDDEEKVALFNTFIKTKENVARFLKVFPVVAATCISCGKIGEPGVYFDMTIIDEAGQCNTAHSLVPILRARQLMLVGDPQQLSPVIVLDARVNAALKRAHKVSDEYDFAKNSVYQAFLSADSVSREILLSHHYRCPPEVIAFNNKKYYNDQLKIESVSAEKFPLAFCEVSASEAHEKNIAPAEAQAAVEYAKANPQETVAIITPFVKQKKLIDELIRESGLKNASCGTIHAFQGDEKDVVLLSLALTDKTPAGTYEWLKSNRELINVATSRAKSKLVVFGNEAQIARLHRQAESNACGTSPDYKAVPTNIAQRGGKDEDKIDDVFDLIEYIKSSGKYSVTPHKTASRALGVKPFSTETEEEFLQTLGHALDNVLTRAGKCSLRKEVPISAVFEYGNAEPDLFFKGRFDFVIFERGASRREIPILAIELDGKEHYESEIVKRRDRQKDAICREHRLLLIRVDNTYARRYHYIKEILERFFARR